MTRRRDFPARKRLPFSGDASGHPPQISPENYGFPDRDSRATGIRVKFQSAVLPMSYPSLNFLAQARPFWEHGMFVGRRLGLACRSGNDGKKTAQA